MWLYIPTETVVILYGAVQLYVLTGYVVVEYGTVVPYWRRGDRVWYCRSLLGTFQFSMWLQIPTGDVMVEYSAVEIASRSVGIGYGAVYIYWGRCGRICGCLSLLGTGG